MMQLNGTSGARWSAIPPQSAVLLSGLNGSVKRAVPEGRAWMAALWARGAGERDADLLTTSSSDVITKRKVSRKARGAVSEAVSPVS